MNLDSTISNLLRPFQQTFNPELKFAPIYLLFLHKKGILQTYLKRESNKEYLSLFEFMGHFDSQNEFEYKSLCDYREKLMDLDNKSSEELIDINLKIQQFENEFSITKYFIYLESHLNDYLVRDFNENINNFDFDYNELLDGILYHTLIKNDIHNSKVPDEVSKLLVYLSDTNKNEVVYNPFSGYNSIGINIEECKHVIAQELNETVFIIGLIKLCLADKSKIVSICSDSLKDIKFGIDCIITCPPFGVRLYEELSGYRDLETYLIDTYSTLLNDNQIKRVIITLTEGFLFKTSTKRIRKFLVDNNLIKSIIKLPKDIYQNTNISSLILVLEKESFKIQFVDCSECRIKNKRSKYNSKYILDLNEIKNIYEDEQNKNKVNVDRKKLEQNDYQLIFGLYLHNLLEKPSSNFINKPLGDLIKRVNTTKPKYQASYYERKIDIGDLNFKSGADSQVHFDEINLNNYSVLSITPTSSTEKNVLLISKVGEKLKAQTYTFSSRNKVLISKNILIYELKDKKSVLGYICHELSKKYVQDQKIIYNRGNTIPYITISDLERINIEMIPFEYQKELVIQINQLILELESKNKEEFFRRSEQYEKRRTYEFGTIRHSTKTKIASSRLELEELIRFFSSKNKLFDELNKMYQEEFGDTDILSALTLIDKNNNEISNLLSSKKDSLDLRNYPLKKVEIGKVLDLLKTYEKGFYRFDIEIDYTLDSELTLVSANLELIPFLIDELLNNANKHAFEIPKETDKVIISLEEEPYNIRLTYKDNGKGFPDGFEKESFIINSVTSKPDSGDGEGGYTINQIGEYLSTEWKFESNPSNDFPVKFNFFFNKL